MTEQSHLYRGTRVLVIAAALVIIIGGINQAQSVLVSFLVAVFLAVIGTPPVLWLERKRIPSVVTVLLVVAGMIAAEPHAEGEHETDVPCGCGTPRLSLGLRTGSDFRGYCKMADLLDRNEMGN